MNHDFITARCYAQCGIASVENAVKELGRGVR